MEDLPAALCPVIQITLGFVVATDAGCGVLFCCG